MESKTKTPQIYGYSVCLVAIITFLIALTALLTSIIDSSAPLLAWGDTEHLSSFQNFKLDVYKGGQQETLNMFDEASLKQMYDDAVRHKISRVKHQTMKNIIVNSLLIVICIVLFVIHWVWMRKFSRNMN